MKRGFNFILYSNLFISFCAAAITAETFLLIGVAINFHYVLFVFFATLAQYAFPVLIEKNYSLANSERHQWVFKHKKFVLAGFVISLVVTGGLLLFFPHMFIVWFLPIGVISFAYYIPQSGLRSTAGVNAGSVAIVWTGVTALFPILFAEDFLLLGPGNYKYATIMFLNFLYIFPLCLIYNVRDMEADRKAGITTFALVHGVKKSIALSVITLALFVVFVIVATFSLEIKIALALSAIISTIVIYFASEKKTDYYYSFWIDGMILLQAVLVWGWSFY